MRNERIRDRASDIRGTWSPQERSLRARNAERRQTRLLAMLEVKEPRDPNWAVGSMGVDDFTRLFGPDWHADDTSPVEPSPAMLLAETNEHLERISPAA